MCSPYFEVTIHPTDELKGGRTTTPMSVEAMPLYVCVCGTHRHPSGWGKNNMAHVNTMRCLAPPSWHAPPPRRFPTGGARRVPNEISRHTIARRVAGNQERAGGALPQPAAQITPMWKASCGRAMGRWGGAKTQQQAATPHKQTRPTNMPQSDDRIPPAANLEKQLAMSRSWHNPGSREKTTTQRVPEIWVSGRADWRKMRKH